ncbi:hypothetical protein BZA05DRAFT_402001 [Tricharina praecox]|uniref:uncharacterized protein n=1 Tax=Tricharina praecox TaxID=43433 RepID=UPI00221F8A4D|nr:uncharacterized protein BZA05DRAFT_402001 [Tricharina praecox]KAI5849019.1 hypothetical protein BZA05DRAFT_402001 [Tricharina praecox]
MGTVRHGGTANPETLMPIPSRLIWLLLVLKVQCRSPTHAPSPAMPPRLPASQTSQTRPITHSAGVASHGLTPFKFPLQPQPQPHAPSSLATHAANNHLFRSDRSINPSPLLTLASYHAGPPGAARSSSGTESAGSQVRRFVLAAAAAGIGSRSPMYEVLYQRPGT